MEETAAPVSDHRPKVSKKKRQAMRSKLLDAAMRVFAVTGASPPVIDDVIREANVSRGTFYNYFDSLDQVLLAIGQELNNQMTSDILPVYDVLTKPWQRAAVAFRLFLVRALLDPKWAGFVTRADTWQHDTLVAEYMAKDLENGKAAGDFKFDRTDAATDFLMGSSAHGIQAIQQGVDNPQQYMDTAVRLTLASLGCGHEMCEASVAFSITYLKSWVSGELAVTKPEWALNMSAEVAESFLNYSPNANNG